MVTRQKSIQSQKKLLNFVRISFEIFPKKFARIKSPSRKGWRSSSTIYTITRLLCPFSLVVDRDLLKDTHRWRQTRQITSADLFFLFHAPPKSSNKPWVEFLLYKTNRLHFSVCVYCNRSQKTSWRVENHSTSSPVVLFCSLHAVTSSVIYYSTHTGENVIYLLILVPCAGKLWRNKQLYQGS